MLYFLMDENNKIRYNLNLLTIKYYFIIIYRNNKRNTITQKGEQFKMTGVELKLKALSNTFTDSEKRIAEFFEANIAEIPYMSVYEAAQKNNVSVPTITRLTKKIGYERYRDFKIDLVKDSSKIINEVFDTVSASAEGTDDDIINKVFLNSINSLEGTKQLLDYKNLIELADAILNAGKVVFFGIGSSGYVASDAALRLAHLDIQAEAYTEPIQMLLHSSRLDENCVAVGISHSGCTQFTVKALHIAKGNGAVTASISNYLNTPLTAESDYQLCTSFTENKVRTVALSSSIAQHCIIDSLYLLLAKYMLINQKLWEMNDIEEIIEQSVRIK